MMRNPPPRIYCIPATKAPVVAVIRRGPSKWFHLGRWDLATWRYEPGAWFHGMIYQRRADLSPDGRYFSYLARKPGARWEHGETYVAVSRLPWLKALCAFGTCGTWTRGYGFEKGGRSRESDVPSLPGRYRLTALPMTQFALERERGWSERFDSPRRAANDWFDEGRGARMGKPQPGGTHTLCMERLRSRSEPYFRNRPPVTFGDENRVGYWLDVGGNIRRLSGAQWADWDTEGHLLLATRRGALQAWRLGDTESSLIFEADLSGMKPVRTHAPAWASRW